ncbi:type VII secretion system-associated protein [Streptomyces sp. NPDC052727]|uniref:type VII secretion system-associated protein n=1 Tax=Streptomyces sp. NPDC052727 TaxID=3154854 RepID=UPI00344417B4
MSENTPARTSAESEGESGDFVHAGAEPEKNGDSASDADSVSETPGAGGMMPAVSGAEAPEPDPGHDMEEGVSGADETMPPIPEEIREAGRLAPDHWLGMVDPAWKGDGAPPEWAMVGRWRSGLDGEIVEWQDNEDYRPSPKALGWPEPADEVDAAVQLAATGYGPGEDVVKALAHHEVAVMVKPGGGPLSATTPDDTAVVPVFTSPVYLHAMGRLAFELTRVPDLLGLVPEGHLLYLNPSGPVSMTVDPDVLREEVEDRETRDAVADFGDVEAPAEARFDQHAPTPSRSRPVTTVSLDDPGEGSSSEPTVNVSEALSGSGGAELTDKGRTTG